MVYWMKLFSLEGVLIAWPILLSFIIHPGPTVIPSGKLAGRNRSQASSVLIGKTIISSSRINMSISVWEYGPTVAMYPAKTILATGSTTALQYKMQMTFYGFILSECVQIKSKVDNKLASRKVRSICASSYSFRKPWSGVMCSAPLISPDEVAFLLEIRDWSSDMWRNWPRHWQGWTLKQNARRDGWENQVVPLGGLPTRAGPSVRTTLKRDAEFQQHLGMEGSMFVVSQECSNGWWF